MSSAKPGKNARTVRRLARAAARGTRRGGQQLIVDGYAPTQMIADLRKYQSELEIQNQALRYSQQEAEG
ncbi:MAG: hypothetical protein ACR2I0_02540, partial [Rhodoferax sp.]